LNEGATKTGTEQIVDNYNRKIAALNEQCEKEGNPQRYTPVAGLVGVGNRNFHIPGVSGFQSICVHAGTSASSSEGCLIVGRERKEAAVSNPYKRGEDFIKGNAFSLGASQMAMADLLELYDCVKKKIGRKPTMKIKIQ
jgi:hypothetical protein